MPVRLAKRRISFSAPLLGKLEMVRMGMSVKSACLYELAYYHDTHATLPALHSLHTCDVVCHSVILHYATYNEAFVSIKM